MHIVYQFIGILQSQEECAKKKKQTTRGETRRNGQTNEAEGMKNLVHTIPGFWGLARLIHVQSLSLQSLAHPPLYPTSVAVPFWCRVSCGVAIGREDLGGKPCPKSPGC